MPPRHLAAGNINIDFYVYVERMPLPDEELPVESFSIGPGGAAANYAVGVSLAGHESHLLAHTTRHVRALGVLDALEKKGVRLDHVVIHEEGVPGMVVIIVTRGGESSMLKIRGVNKLLTGSEVSGETFDVIHVASVEPRVFWNLVRRNHARLSSYDPGGAIAISASSEVARLAGEASILSLNAREFIHVFGYSLARVASTLPDEKYILIRLGARGSILAGNKLAYYAASCRLGAPVDTTGAGDAFNAYLNAWLAEGRSIEDALVAASVAAGLKVLREGAQSIPERSEVEKHISRCADGVRRISLEDAESMVREVV